MYYRALSFSVSANLVLIHWLVACVGVWIVCLKTTNTHRHKCVACEHRIPHLNDWQRAQHYWHCQENNFGVLQPFLCLCMLPRCIRSWRNCKLCTELSEILGVTYYPEKLARRKSLLVFCALCNCEQTVPLKKSLLFPCWGKKKNQASAFFVITAVVGVLFPFFF